ncbi:hypothetical protein V6R21_32295 [Limibacter armeniacum]|uniref:hypothetical protein n=1 Tax=Limibacter armeniacum TaxID=466084 RepID=UPI002FE61BD1
MKDIKKYLEQKTPSYEAGVRLYLKYGKNRNLVALFQRGKTDYNVRKLNSVLKYMYLKYEQDTNSKKAQEEKVKQENQPIKLEAAEETTAEQEAEDTEAPAEQEAEEVDFKEGLTELTEPDDRVDEASLEPLYKERRALYDEFNFLFHNKLNAQTHIEERKEAALRCKEIAIKILPEVHNKLDAAKNGEKVVPTPEPTTLSEEEQEEVKKKIVHAQKMISKYRKDDSKAHLVEKWEDTLAELKASIA